MANNNRGTFITNTSVSRVHSVGRGRNCRFSGFKTSIFHHVRALPVPIVTTIGNFTLNNNYRLSVTYSVHVTSAGTLFKRPRIGLNVLPKFSNSIHLGHVINRNFTGRLVCANHGIGTSRTLTVNLIGEMIRPRTLLSRIIGVTGAVVRGSPVTIHCSGRDVGHGNSVSVSSTVRLRSALFKRYFTASSRGRNVATFLRGHGTAFRGGW